MLEKSDAVPKSYKVKKGKVFEIPRNSLKKVGHKENVKYHALNIPIKNAEGKEIASVYGRVVIKPVKLFRVSGIHVDHDLKEKYKDLGGPGVGREIVRELKRISKEKDLVISLHDGLSTYPNHPNVLGMYRDRYSFREIIRGYPELYYCDRELTKEEEEFIKDVYCR
jgi:ribosomal protein S18 acetylase RimI-like enzyme